MILGETWSIFLIRWIYHVHPSGKEPGERDWWWAGGDLFPPAGFLLESKLMVSVPSPATAEPFRSKPN